MIIEVLHPRSGAVVTRRRVTSFPFTLGRALDNALVLDDPHVDAHHAHLVEEAETGALVLEDLGSLNGLRPASQGRVPLFRPEGGSEVLLGRTRLRFRDEHAPVAPAIPLGAEPAVRPARSPALSLARSAIVLVIFVIVGVGSWLASDSRGGVNEALSLALGLAIFAGVWAGIWAAVSRVVVHEANFSAHLLIAATTILVITLAGKLDEWFTFLFPGTTVWTTLMGVIWLVALTAALAEHLAYASTKSRMRRWRAGVVTSLLVLAVGGLFSLAEDDGFTDVPVFPKVIKLTPLGMVPTVGTSEFSALHAKLREQVDSLAALPPRD